jgi:hypothetical protein
MEDSAESSKSQQTEQNQLPGTGGTRLRPLELGGEFYDPFHPPKLARQPDGSEHYVGGRKLEKDDVYSERFWSRPEHQIDGYTQAMMENIQKSADGTGNLGMYVPSTGPDEKSKEKMSAYRKMAKDMGYIVGGYHFVEADHMVIATIVKPKTLHDVANLPDGAMKK